MAALLAESRCGMQGSKSLSKRKREVDAEEQVEREARQLRREMRMRGHVVRLLTPTCPLRPLCLALTCTWHGTSKLSKAGTAQPHVTRLLHPCQMMCSVTTTSLAMMHVSSCGALLAAPSPLTTSPSSLPGLDTHATHPCPGRLHSTSPVSQQHKTLKHCGQSLDHVCLSWTGL